VNEIDELEGEELAEAVALKRGLERGFGGFWTLPPEPDDAEGGREICLDDYRPDLNIAQAWELDGEGWEWRFLERSEYLVVSIEGASGRHSIYQVDVVWADFPTKANAYATARCLAYLKAMA